MSRSPKTAVRLKTFMHAEILPRHLEMQRFVAANPAGARPEFTKDLKCKAREQGLWNLGLPDLTPDMPGTRLDNAEFAPLAEILGQVYWAAEIFNCHAPDLPNMEMLAKIGTEAQKRRWLTPLLLGDISSAFGMTEPKVASSDARNISCRIEDAGDHLRLNGHKWFVGNITLPNLEFVIVMGESDPDAAPNARHSAVIVPVDTPGFEIVREVPVLGFQHRYRPHGEVILNDVRVPKENLLGAWGKGFAAAQVRLATARIHHCMRSIGGAELMIGLMCERAERRTTFGVKLSERDKIQEFVALSRIEIDQARMITLAAARTLDAQGSKAAQREISVIKLAVARACFAVADRAVQVFGAMGLTDDSPVADFYAAMRAFRIYDGPDEVHMRTIAKHEFKRQAQARDTSLTEFFCTDFSQSRPRMKDLAS